MILKFRYFLILLFFPVVFTTYYLLSTNVTLADTGGVTLTVTISEAAVCSNGVAETGEQCDSADLGGETCVSRGFLSGTLSCNADCTFNTSACTSAAPVTSSVGGGGGGGGAVVSAAPQTAVTFSGRAYPLSRVTILKDGQISITTIADPDANFNAALTGLSAGNYVFSVYGEDDKGARSTLFSFSVFITQGATTNIGGIFISPTIAVDKSEVRRGDNITIFGQTARRSEVTIAINSEEEYFVKTQADKNGVYLHNFDTSSLDLGDHTAKSKAALDGSASKFSALIPFRVGTKNVLAPKITAKRIIRGDVNGEGRVNLIDFSIVAYWHNRANPPAKVDLNGDGKVNLVDFSIMAYYWTG